MNIVNEWHTISCMDVFKDLPRETVVEILSGAKPRSFPKNSTVFLQEDPADWFYLVLDGWVKTFRTTFDGDEAVLNILGQGDVIACSEIFGGDVHSVNCVTVLDAQLLPLSIKKIRSITADNSDVAMGFLSYLSRQVQKSEDDIEKLKTKSALEAVAELLLTHCNEVSGPSFFLLPYSKTLIAQKLGLRPESLSRIFSKLKKYGVSMRHDNVVVKEVQMLRSLGDQDYAEARTA